MLEAAYAAWQATKPGTIPLAPNIGEDSCGGFCDWKAWCPHWWQWRYQNNTLHKGDFSDAIVLLHNYDQSSGSAGLNCASQGMAMEELCQQVSGLGQNLTIAERRH